MLIHLDYSIFLVYFNRDANWRHVCPKRRQAVQLRVAVQVILREKQKAVKKVRRLEQG
jgi:hypothetical protein